MYDFDYVHTMTLELIKFRKCPVIRNVVKH